LSPVQKAVLRDIAKKYSKTVHQIILNFLIGRHPVVTVMRTTSKIHLKENIQSLTFKLSKQDVKMIENTFPIEYHYIPVNDITVSLNGEWNHDVYQNLDQAIENKFGFTPSPADLAKSIKNIGYLKPVRLKLSTDVSSSNKYELVGGRIRYWAWVIAHGDNCPAIPAYIRNNYTKS